MKSTCILRTGLFALSVAALVVAPIPAQEIPPNPPVIPDDNSKPPHVLLMSMGGRIASRGDPRLNITNYGGKGVPRVEPEDWVHDLPELAAIARVTTEDFRSPIDRAYTETFEDLQKVAKRLNEIAQDSTIDGIVVTHGTNTMVEAAYYMNLVVKTTKPIVFIGSHRPCPALSGDCPLTLYNAVPV